MNQGFASSSRALLAAAVLVAMSVPSLAAVDSGSTGADLAFNPIVDTDVQLPPSGVLNYTTVNIPANVRVTFLRNATNTPVYLLASGNVTIAGTIDVSGGDAAHSGTYMGGVVADDGLPGSGGPGGYDGGRGGRQDETLRAALIAGGAGLGPGGGPGGIAGADNVCTTTRYWKHPGVGGAHSSNTFPSNALWNCSGTSPSAFAYGSSLLQPLIGGSGGGGGRGGSNYAGSGGGGGGGAILIASSGEIHLASSGAIFARGGDSGGVNGTGVGGRGGGGSGGAIRLVATRVSGSGKLFAEGGCSHSSNQARQLCGSAGSSSQFGGSDGRIRIEGESITYSGVSTPAYIRGDVGPIFIAETPTLRIASVAGVAVPPNPTGLNDVNLPASTTGPVEIVFETVNIPAGNTVTLRVVPAYGEIVERLSPAINAAGTTQVSVTLPQGPSTLQATTTYTVVIAMQTPDVQTRLAKLADDEAVERVEVTAGLHGAARATLVTVSGRRIELPFETVAAVGLKS